MSKMGMGENGSLVENDQSWMVHLLDMVELAEEVFRLPVRLGIPHYTGSLSEVVRSPIYATAIGLLLFGHRHQSRPEVHSKAFGWADQPIQRMRSWFSKYFTEE